MELLKDRHAKYLKRCLSINPCHYQSLDTSRLTLLFYALSGLDVLDRLDEVDNRQAIIDWIYSLQIVSDCGGSNQNRSGFRGSTTHKVLSTQSSCREAAGCDSPVSISSPAVSVTTPLSPPPSPPHCHHHQHHQSHRSDPQPPSPKTTATQISTTTTTTNNIIVNTTTSSSNNSNNSNNNNSNNKNNNNSNNKNNNSSNNNENNATTTSENNSGGSSDSGSGSGTSGLGGSSDSGLGGSSQHELDCAHVTMTYAALGCLLVLGDDLSRVARPALLAAIGSLQLHDGSFKSTQIDGESDMRFVYCACAVCHILNSWQPVGGRQTVQFIRDSMGFDYGISQAPCLESHGGSTFCACASLHLLGRLSETFTKQQSDGLLKWCLQRQIEGFTGRPNKAQDTCYTFWLGSSIQLLGGGELIDRQRVFHFVLRHQDPITGGFSKSLDTAPDPLHTYLSLAGLSVLGYPGLSPLNPALNITERAANNLKEIHSRWSAE